MPETYEFVQLDVFTKIPLIGNPLAIFTDGRGLSDEPAQWPDLLRRRTTFQGYE